MTRRRWIADEVAGNTAALVGDHASHLSRVLRAKVGQEFDISVGGAVRRGTITSISDKRVEFALGEEEQLNATPHLTLILSIFKFDRMEWAIEKCTEIGVSGIVPLLARRTDAHLATAAVKRRERWERIALQASEQSRRIAPPKIATPIKFAQLDGSAAASPASQSVLRVVLTESSAADSLRSVVETRLAASQEPPPLRSAANIAQLILAIGPEGGWTDDELDWFRESGWSFASLGDTILRAETAAIVASAIALDCMR
jgi:16S rRNA (uracil1498-N3)-methyltransferase